MDAQCGPTANPLDCDGPAIDFAALFKEFDTAVMGRKTYEVLTEQGGHGALPGSRGGRLLTDSSSGTHPASASSTMIPVRLCGAQGEAQVATSGSTAEVTSFAHP